MIVYSFDSGYNKKHHCLANSHSGDLVPNGGPKCVKEKAFDRVIVEGAESVRDVKSVMARMECC